MRQESVLITGSAQRWARGVRYADQMMPL